MNKSELVAAVAKKANATKVAANEVIDALIDVITNAVKKGDEVRLVGWGTFYQTKTKAREGRNPRTGATLKIPAAKQPKFRAGAVFKAAVNK